MAFTNGNKDEITIVLLDYDPIFTLGFKEILKEDEYQDLNIIATGKPSEIISLLPQYQPRLWLVSLDSYQNLDKVKQFLGYLPQINQEYSHISLVILFSSNFLPDLTSFSIIKGYCAKNANISELVKMLRICAENKNYFNYQTSIQQKKYVNWFYQQCQIGLKEIQKEMNSLENYIQHRNLSITDAFYWQGRQRELKLTRWLITKIMPFPVNNYPQISEDKTINNNSEPTINSSITNVDRLDNVYDITLAKIKASVKNSTPQLMEIDILQESKKQELLITILEEWKVQIQQLQNLSIDSNKFEERIYIFIKEIWQNSARKFLSRYYEDKEVYLFELIIKESNLFYQEIFNKIPFLEQIITYQIAQKEMIIDSQVYEYNSESAKELEEILLQNTILILGNATMIFTLNRLNDDVKIKQNLFNLELKSSRKVAMFRNNLVWQYRQEKYWLNPKNIFEDEYKLMRLGYQGIETCTITHPRHKELNNLKGLPWLVTILIELRDSLSKGVKALGDSLGKALVYVLTEVIGKAIGLIGKGILQGIGNRIKS